MDYTGYIPIHANDQVIAPTTSVVESGVAPKGVSAVRLDNASADIHFRLDGVDPGTNNSRLRDGGTEYFPASPGMTVKARTASGTASLSVTWMRAPK